MGLSCNLYCEAGSFLLPPHPPQVFSVRAFETLFPRARTLGCVVCLAPQLFLPVCLHTNVGVPSPPPLPGFQPLSCCASSLLQLPISAPPTSLNECFLFNSLVVRLHTVGFSGSSGYFLFLKLLLSLFWLHQEAKCIYLRLHLGQKSQV